MDKLHYIDHKQDELREVEYTRDRAISVAPIFYSNKRDGLIALKSHIEMRVQKGVCSLIDIEKELAAYRSDKI